jgi:hypothetical protein
MKEHRLRVFETRAYLDPRGMKKLKAGENCTLRRFIACTLWQIKLDLSVKEYEMKKTSSMHGRKRNA